MVDHKTDRELAERVSLSPAEALHEEGQETLIKIMQSEIGDIQEIIDQLQQMKGKYHNYLCEVIGRISGLKPGMRLNARLHGKDIEVEFVSVSKSWHMRKPKFSDRDFEDFRKGNVHIKAKRIKKDGTPYSVTQEFFIGEWSFKDEE